MGTRAATVGPHDEYAPVLKSAEKSIAVSFPRRSAATRARMREGCLLYTSVDGAISTHRSRNTPPATAVPEVVKP